MSMENISAHITYEEAVHSDTAVRLKIDNVPTGEQIDNMKFIAENVFEKLRAHFGKPIAISSFFRNRALNKAVGGADNSQHTTGQAMDINARVMGGLTNKDIFYFIKDNLQFDQLIWEYGTDSEPDWVHVSLKRFSNRGDILQITKLGTKRWLPK